jgi:hypothetical protein
MGKACSTNEGEEIMKPRRVSRQAMSYILKERILTRRPIMPWENICPVGRRKAES